MDPSDIYTYEKYSFKILTLLMALLTFFFMFSSKFLAGAISFSLGALLTISYQGVRIDREKQKYLKYDRFLSFKIGAWKAYSKPSYVTIVRINLSSSRNLPAPMVLPDDKKGAKSFKVNLVVEGRERFINVCRGPKETMIQEALKLGTYMGVRVLDFTTSEKKWIL
jgi:hypothetical protein